MPGPLDISDYDSALNFMRGRRTTQKFLVKWIDIIFAAFPHRSLLLDLNFKTLCVGLDARAAAIVMRTVRNIVDTGRTIGKDTSPSFLISLPHLFSGGSHSDWQV